MPDFPDKLYAVPNEDDSKDILAYPSMGDCGCPGERLTIATYKLVEVYEYELQMQCNKIEKGKT